MLRKFKILLILIISSHILYGQNCTNYYKTNKCANYLRKGFYLHGQSRSALMEIGTISQLEAVLQGGRDYIVSLCADPQFYPIHFIIESADEGKVLYDNMHDDYLDSIGFTLENTQNISIKIELLAEGYKPVDFDDNRSCVGVSIQFKKTPQLGF